MRLQGCNTEREEEGRDWMGLPPPFPHLTNPLLLPKMRQPKKRGLLFGQMGGGGRCLDKKEVRIDGQGCKRTFRAAVVRYCGLVKPRRRGEIHSRQNRQNRSR